VCNIEQTTITLFFDLIMCNEDGTKPCLKIILALNSLWRWLELEVFKIQRIGLKTIPKVPLKTKMKVESRSKALSEIEN
jgi:hypothetical protein